MPNIGTGHGLVCLSPLGEGQYAQMSLCCLTEVSVSNAVCACVGAPLSVLPRGKELMVKDGISQCQPVLRVLLMFSHIILRTTLW